MVRSIVPRNVITPSCKNVVLRFRRKEVSHQWFLSNVNISSMLFSYCSSSFLLGRHTKFAIRCMFSWSPWIHIYQKKNILYWESFFSCKLPSTIEIKKIKLNTVIKLEWLHMFCKLKQCCCMLQVQRLWANWLVNQRAISEKVHWEKLFN